MKSPEEQLNSFNGKALWLTSFPKSGNTWFRCFLSALFSGTIDLNKINTNGIFSNRVLLDQVHDIDSRLLDEDETKLRLRKLYQFHLKHTKKLLFIKVHDAHTNDVNGVPLFPADITHRVVYLVRNPLDIVASYANHNNSTIDQSIKMMNDEQGYLARQKDGFNINNQLPQLMYSWSGHVNSWLDQDNIPYTIVRYEDMKKKGLETFAGVMKDCQFEFTDKEIQEAMDLTKFEKLKAKEEKDGFREKNAASESFFRKGQTGGWVSELTKEQAQKIIDKHHVTMTRLGYEIPNLDEVYADEKAQ